MFYSQIFTSSRKFNLKFSCFFIKNLWLVLSSSSSGPENHKSLRWISTGYPSDEIRFVANERQTPPFLANDRRVYFLGLVFISLTGSGARRLLATNRISSGGYPANIHRRDLWFSGPGISVGESGRETRHNKSRIQILRIFYYNCIKYF